MCLSEQRLMYWSCDVVTFGVADLALDTTDQVSTKYFWAVCTAPLETFSIAKICCWENPSLLRVTLSFSSDVLHYHSSAEAAGAFHIEPARTPNTHGTYIFHRPVGYNLNFSIHFRKCDLLVITVKLWRQDKGTLHKQWLKIYLVPLVKAAYDCKVLKCLLHSLNTLTGVSKNSQRNLHIFSAIYAGIYSRCLCGTLKWKILYQKNLQCPNLKHNILWFLKKNLFWGSSPSRYAVDLLLSHLLQLKYGDSGNIISAASTHLT